MSSDHPLAAVLAGCVRGAFPPVDGVVEVVPPDDTGTWAIIEFTGHALVLCGRPATDIVFSGVDAFGGVTQPGFVLSLAGKTATIGSHDAVLARRGGGDGAALGPTDRYDEHPRVLRARHHRRDVRVLGDERGLVTVGSGLVGRTEISVEVAGPAAAPGAGRALIAEGIATVSSDEWVFAQVAPGNAASLRAFLACGFTPIGSEILIER